MLAKQDERIEQRERKNSEQRERKNSALQQGNKGNNTTGHNRVAAQAETFDNTERAATEGRGNGERIHDAAGRRLETA